MHEIVEMYITIASFYSHLICESFRRRRFMRSNAEKPNPVKVQSMSPTSVGIITYI